MAIRQENSRYGWRSIDPFIWSQNTFWYSENIDIRNDLKGIQLLSKPYERNIWNNISCYVKFSINELVRLYANWDVSLWNNTSFWDTIIWNIGVIPQWATKFRDHIYVFSYNKILSFTITWWVLWAINDITPAWWNVSFDFFSSWLPTLNFWNSALLVWRWNQLWRWVPTTNTWPIPTWWWTAVRTLDKAEIRWVIGRSSNIEIYVNYNWVDSRVYFIWWFWDAVDTGISNTIILENLSIVNIWQVWERTFILCNNIYNVAKSQLYEISWYNKRLIKESTLNAWDTNYHSDFKFSTAYQNFPVSQQILYLPFFDQVWSYGRESDDIWDNLCSLRPWQVFIWGVSFWDYLYLSSDTLWVKKEHKYTLNYRHNDYIQSPWTLISKIHDGGMMWLRKQLKSIYIWYKLDTTYSPTDIWSIEIYLRTDMAWYNITDWWIHIITIDNPNYMREIIESPQITVAWIDDFSTIQYKVVLNPSISGKVSPFLYEIAFNYDDQIQAVS